MNPCIDLNPCTNGSHNCMFPRGICHNTTLYDYVCNCSSGHREISGMCSVCEPPSVIMFGSFTPQTSSYNASETVTYSCVMGRVMLGSAVRTCLSNGQWTAPPTCINNTCITGPCLNGGTCQNQNSQVGYICVCTSQYQGQQCENEKFSFVQRTIKLFRDEFNNLNSPEALAFIEEFKRVEMPLFRITNIIRLHVTKLRRGSTIVEFEALVGPSSANVTHEELLIEINQAINSNTLNTTLLIGGPSAGLPNITAECSMTPSQEGIPPGTLQNSVLDSSLSCAENLIGIRFNVCNLTRSGITADRIVIAGPGQDVLNVSESCKPNFIRTSDGQTSATFLLFDILSCGVQAMMTEREIRLSYYVRSLPPVADSKKVQRYYNTMSVFNCTFNRTALVDTMIVPKIQKVSFANPAVSGQFQIVLNLFRDRNFTTMFQSVDGKTPTVKVSDYIYFKASIGLSGAVLQASQCWATPSNNPNDTLKYVVIKSGCPSTVDRAAINVVSNYQSMNVKAGFKSFVWVSTPTRSIYIHCTVSVCFSSVSNCTGPVCGGRKRRDLGYDKDPKIYSVGPVIIETPCDVPGVCDHQCSMDDQYQAVCSCYAGFALGPDGRTCSTSLDESSDQSVDFMDNVFTLVMVVLMLSAVGVLVFNSRNGRKIAVSEP